MPRRGKFSPARKSGRCAKAFTLVFNLKVLKANVESSTVVFNLKVLNVNVKAFTLVFNLKVLKVDVKVCI